MLQPTYTTEEAILLMYKLDYEGLFILAQVINEEKKRYSLYDLALIKEAYEVIKF